MSKNLENTKIKKLPTSQLIFYMTNPDLNDEKLKSKIELTLYQRLTKSYKLDHNMTGKFIEREKEIIITRGYNLENYSFGRDLAYDEHFKIFYDSIEFISKAVNLNYNFNTLTMSEIVEFHILFRNFKNLYEQRLEKLEKVIKNNKKAQNRVLNDEEYFLMKNQQLIADLKEAQQIIQQQKNNEESMIEYNGLLADELINKLKLVMGYEYTNNKIAVLTIIKEAILLIQKSSIQKKERKLYNDITFDAYEHDTKLISEYNVQGYPFSKQRYF